MLPTLTVAIVVFAVLAVRRLPAPLWRAYRASFALRHGLNFQIGVAVLATLALAMLMATLTLAEHRPLVELLNAALVASMVALGAFDLTRFARRRRLER